MGQPTVLSCFLWRHHKLKQPLNKMGNLINHLLSTKDSGDPEPWWASLVRVGASSAWPDIFPQASLHLVQLWLAVSFFFIYGLGLLVTPFLCQWFVEPKDKTGLNPYHNKYLFLSEGRASPIYLCIFVQRQVGFQCICNWKKNSLFFQGWVQEDWKPVHASLISSWCSLHQCAREYFALWNGFWL